MKADTRRRMVVGNRMDQRIVSFLADVLALAVEDPDVIHDEVCVADYRAIFRAQEPSRRMRAPDQMPTIDPLLRSSMGLQFGTNWPISVGPSFADCQPCVWMAPPAALAKRTILN
jgi:hypothetical protein